jgi:hypothetical protein
VAGDLPLDLLKLRTWPEPRVDRLTGHVPGQVVLRPMPEMTGLRAHAVRLPALTADRVQRPAAEVTDLADQVVQPRTAALQPREIGRQVRPTRSATALAAATFTIHVLRAKRRRQRPLVAAMTIVGGSSRST